MSFCSRNAKCSTICIGILWIGVLMTSFQVRAEEEASTADEPYASWHVQDEQLVDANQHSVVLRGINCPGLEFGEGNNSPSNGGGVFSYYHRHIGQEFDNIKSWGFNVVRLPISWANLEPGPPTGSGADVQHQYNDVYLQAIDEAVHLARDRGLPVVLSMHHNQWSAAHRYQNPNGKTVPGGGMPKWLDPSGDALEAEDAFLANEHQEHRQLIDAWVMLAKRYASTPNMIGIDVYNEAQPRKDAMQRANAVDGLFSLYDRAGKAIHGASPRLLLVFQDMADRDPRLSRIPKIPNAIYSFHSYEPWPAGQAHFDAHVQRAHQLGVPVWVGEFGRRGDADWKSSLQKQVDSMKQRKISWSVFAYQMYQWPLFGATGQGPLDEAQLAVLKSGM